MQCHECVVSYECSSSHDPYNKTKVTQNARKKTFMVLFTLTISDLTFYDVAFLLQIYDNRAEKINLSLIIRYKRHSLRDPLRVVLIWTSYYHVIFFLAHFLLLIFSTSGEHPVLPSCVMYGSFPLPAVECPMTLLYLWFLYLPLAARQWPFSFKVGVNFYRSNPFCTIVV